MATRGTIAVVHNDGSISEIYMHWDSQVSHSGRLLFLYYNTLDLVEQLVSGGSISYLGDHIIPRGKHSFLKPEKGCTVYFSRDRGDEGISVKKYQSLNDYLDSDNICDYHYLFMNNEWKVRSSWKAKTFTPLVELLLEAA